MWIRYTPNIALSNRLLQHGRPWLWVSKPIICSCASRRFHHECHPPQVDCTWWGYPAGAWLFDRNTRTSQRLCSEETSLRGALRATWGVKKHLVAWVLQRILKYIFFLVTPKYAKKRHKGKNQVLPNCAFSTRNVVFFQIQWSGEWFNCNHPSIEPFAAQRCFCTRNSRNCARNSRMLEIPGEQFSHITGFFDIPCVLHFCFVPFFLKCHLFVTFVTFFAGKIPSIKNFATWCLKVYIYIL